MASKPPKSILKKTTYKPSPLAQPPSVPDTISISPPPTTSTKPTPSEARAIALSHAHALQIRKALELSILLSLEELVDFPTPPPTPTPTTHHDTTALKRHLRYFQPSDYDSLIEERNILSHCGYPLCPHPKKSSPTPSKYVLVDKGRPTMRFVERAKLERFCSDTCARRGLWLRVQLNEEPSWLRGEVIDGVEVGAKGEVYGLDLDGERWNGGDMVLLEEVEERRRVESGTGAKEGDLKKLVEELKGLGIESRGLLGGKVKTLEEQKGVAFVVGGKEVSGGTKPLAFTIEEKEVSSSGVVPPSADVASAVAALAIEGYNPRRGPEDYLPKKKAQAIGEEK